MPGLVARTPIIAVGTWTSASEREAVLTVSEALKGTAVGAEISVDNRQSYIGADCSTYGEFAKARHRFSSGQQSVIFLEKEVDGLWHVGYFSLAAYDLPADDLAPLTMPGRDLGVTLSELTAMVPASTDPTPPEASSPTSGVEVSVVQENQGQSKRSFSGRAILVAAASAFVVLGLAA